MSDRDVPLPLSFRASLLEHVLPCLKAGESCSLVGVSGVGKSNIVRFLKQPDVQEHYWGAERVWFVLVDTHGLVLGEQPDEYCIGELMIHVLIREAERRGLPPEFVSELDTLHARLVAQPSAQLAIRYLDRVCSRLCEGLGLQLIFVFDQFEDIWKTVDARFFLNLRHLRDQFKYQLAYLVMTRERLQVLRKRTRDDLPAVEAFWELFTSHVFGLGMYDERDATVMLERMAARRGVAVPPALREAALAASGGHAGLLRAVFWALYQSSVSLSNAELLKLPAVAEECAKIWNDLPQEEQALARSLATSPEQKSPAAPALADLRLKELVAGRSSRLFSPLFADYACAQAGVRETGLTVDMRARTVRRDGQVLEASLSPLEFNLLAYLARHNDTVCKRDDIMRALYNEQMYDASDERLDTLLRRLREALGEDARNPRYLFTHRGVGVRLAHGRLIE